MNSLQLELNYIRSQSESSFVKLARKEALESKFEVYDRACYLLDQQDRSLPSKQRAYRNLQNLMKALDMSIDQFSNLPLLPHKVNLSDFPAEIFLDSQKISKDLHSASAEASSSHPQRVSLEKDVPEQ